jgi:hypothetical protein
MHQVYARTVITCRGGEYGNIRNEPLLKLTNLRPQYITLLARGSWLRAQ